MGATPHWTNRKSTVVEPAFRAASASGLPGPVIVASVENGILTSGAGCDAINAEGNVTPSGFVGKPAAAAAAPPQYGKGRARVIFIEPLRDASIEPIGIRMTLSETEGEQSGVNGLELIGTDEISIVGEVEPRRDEATRASTKLFAAAAATPPVPLLPTTAAVRSFSAATAADDGRGVGEIFVFETICRIAVPALRAFTDTAALDVASEARALRPIMTSASGGDPPPPLPPVAAAADTAPRVMLINCAARVENMIATAAD